MLHLIAAFLTQYGLLRTCRELRIEIRKVFQGELLPDIEDGQLDGSLSSLTELFDDWRSQRQEKKSGVADGKKNERSVRTNGKATVTRMEQDGATSGDESDDDSTGSHSESDSEVVVPVKPSVARKRKDEKMDTSDSTDTSSSSSSEAVIPVKRAAARKRKDEKMDTSDSVDTSSSSSEEINDEQLRPATTSTSSSDSDSSTTSSDEGKPDSGKVNLRDDKKRGGVPLDQLTSKIRAPLSIEGNPKGKVKQPKAKEVDSYAESSSSSPSDSSSASHSHVPVQKVAPGKVSSGSSATLVAEDGKRAAISKSSSSDTSTSTSSSDGSDSELESASLVAAKKRPTATNTKRKRSPEQATDGDNKQLKKVRQFLVESTQTGRTSKPRNKPFSRVPADLPVDERLQSNKYVPYDYAERAHKDLIVTKGKSFTKEKNKKKRGSYRGGTIDINGKNGIKFD